MKRYTFITDYEDGILSTAKNILSDNLEQAEICWVNSIQFPYIGRASILNIKRMITAKEICPCRLKNIKGVSYIYMKVNGKRIESHIIEHKFSSHEENYEYIFVVLYRGGTFVRKVDATSPFDAMLFWAKYLSWHFYNKTEKSCIKKHISNSTPEQILEIEESVWNYQFNVLEYKMYIFIVQL